jgi:mobilome CxxCx(11)CxxC protein
MTRTQQEQELKELRRRAYQTRLIFSKARLAKRGLKWLAFLGIVAPLLTGGIVTSFYATHSAPDWLINTSGFLGFLLAIASVWSLVDEWPRRAYLNDYYGAFFDDLYIKLKTFKPGSDGRYDEQQLHAFSVLSLEGVRGDREDNVSEEEKSWAWGEALKRFP